MTKCKLEKESLRLRKGEDLIMVLQEEFQYSVKPVAVLGPQSRCTYRTPRAAAQASAASPEAAEARGPAQRHRARAICAPPPRRRAIKFYHNPISAMIPSLEVRMW